MRLTEQILRKIEEVNRKQGYSFKKKIQQYKPATVPHFYTYSRDQPKPRISPQRLEHGQETSEVLGSSKACTEHVKKKTVSRELYLGPAQYFAPYLEPVPLIKIESPSQPREHVQHQWATSARDLLQKQTVERVKNIVVDSQLPLFVQNLGFPRTTVVNPTFVSGDVQKKIRPDAIVQSSITRNPADHVSKTQNLKVDKLPAQNLNRPMIAGSGLQSGTLQRSEFQTSSSRDVDASQTTTFYSSEMQTPMRQSTENHKETLQNYHIQGSNEQNSVVYSSIVQAQNVSRDPLRTSQAQKLTPQSFAPPVYTQLFPYHPALEGGLGYQITKVQFTPFPAQAWPAPGGLMSYDKTTTTFEYDHPTPQLDAINVKIINVRNETDGDGVRRNKQVDVVLGPSRDEDEDEDEDEEGVQLISSSNQQLEQLEDVVQSEGRKHPEEDESEKDLESSERFFLKHDKDKGIYIHRLKVRKGGVAIAGPGGVATAGTGGTAIVGPNGVAYTHPDSLAIAGTGTKVVAVDPSINLGDIIKQNGTKKNPYNPRIGKVVAVGPVIYYNRG